jgi:hypothetical protein
VTGVVDDESAIAEAPHVEALVAGARRRVRDDALTTLST